MCNVIDKSINKTLTAKHTPNKETLQAIKDAENAHDLVSTENLEDLFTKLEIDE